MPPKGRRQSAVEPDRLSSRKSPRPIHAAACARLYDPQRRRQGLGDRENAAWSKTFEPRIRRTTQRSNECEKDGSKIRAGGQGPVLATLPERGHGGEGSIVP